jgi:serine/threonine-protein kinase
MDMQEIMLSGSRWRFEESKPLGTPGGFGAVFLGVDENDGPVAVKRLHLETQEHAARELEIADFLTAHNHPHIIPIYAAGKDVLSGQQFIVMARANQSLENLIESSAPIPEEATLEVVTAIAAGLVEIGELVHRDLKPANVLLHNGVWKLADLGLARFVEAATALNTMKDFLSAQYAAPEQWRGERASKKTDVYATGCILYALITGEPPFSGQTQADYSQQHQFASPPSLPASSRLQRLALTCLAKTQELRPSVESLRTQIERIRATSTSGSANPLANAAAVIAEKDFRQEAQELERKKVEKDRAAAADEAVKQFVPMMKNFLDLVVAEAPNARRIKLDSPTKFSDELLIRGSHREREGVALGDGYIMFDIPYPSVEPGSLGTNWNILVGGMIEVGERYSGAGVTGRSANLWFGRIGVDESYRWWEAAYMHTSKADSDQRENHPMEPFSIGQGHSWSGYRYGLYKVRSGDFQLAYNPKPIDGEYYEDFCARWSNWLATISLRQLRQPENLPEETIAPEFVSKF